MMARSFVLFVLAGSLIGIHNAFWHQYRFAASELTTPANRGRAISLVLFGGIVAAIFGPELAKLSRDWFDVVYAGSYLVIACLCVGSLVLIQLVDFPPPKAPRKGIQVRSLRQFTRNPTFVVAILSASIGYGVMVMLMAATPLAMKAHDHSFGETAFVIQWHTLAMFAPSFVTGILIRRVGAAKIVMAGALLEALCIAVSAMGTGMAHFLVALISLGVGWNFLFVGGTTLLAECHEPEERAKIQAVNDFCVFGVVAAASFSAGALQENLGWMVINATAIVPLAIVTIGAIWLLRSHSPAQSE
jgi:predicted MFS family arabinose efflux permease